MTARYIDANALASALPTTFSATSPLRDQLAALVAAQPTYVPPVTDPTPPPTGGAGTRLGKANAFWDDFTGPGLDTTNWTNGKSSSFPNNGPTNVGDTKLDYLDPAQVSVANSQVVFTATPNGKLSNGKTAWHTGLITTEYSPAGFQVKPGDYVEVVCTLPGAKGAWPALWTWKNGGNEVDSFEYHPDNASLLELTNHVSGHNSSDYYTNFNAVAPGKVVTIGTLYGQGAVTWYVNNIAVFTDKTGVGAAWSAYLIVNLSVEDGTYHPAPVGSTPFSFQVDSVGVWR